MSANKRIDFPNAQSHQSLCGLISELPGVLHANVNSLDIFAVFYAGFLSSIMGIYDILISLCCPV